MVKESQGEPPNRKLMTAVRWGQVPEVIAAIAAGADVNFRDQSGFDGFTPLFLAACHGYKEVVETLLSHGASVDLTGPLGMTAMHRAAESSYRDIAVALHNAGATADLEDERYQTPAETAALAGDKEMFRLIKGWAHAERVKRRGSRRREESGTSR